MTPENTGMETAEYTVYPSKTYYMDLSKKELYGYCDGVTAIMQAIYKILATVRYNEIIYTDNYGTELVDFMGKLAPYIWAELEGTITRALLCDDRIEAVRDFEFDEDKQNKLLRVKFTVDSDLGSLTYTEEVSLYV